MCIYICGHARARAYIRGRARFHVIGGRSWPGRGFRCGGGMGIGSDLKKCEQFQRLSGLRICNVDMVAAIWPSGGANTAPSGADGMAL